MGGEFISYKFDGHEKPTARWLVGTDVDQQQAYIVHIGSPGFIAKISDDPEVGMLSGTSYGMCDGRNLYDFIFFKNPPDSESEMVALFRDAEDAIIALDAATA